MRGKQIIYSNYETNNVAEWEEKRKELEDFFEDENWIVFKWRMNKDAFRKVKLIFHNFSELYDEILKGATRFCIYDKNNRLYAVCDYHGEEYIWEIKRINYKGQKYYDEWKASGDDSKTELEVLDEVARWGSNNAQYAKLLYS